MAFYHWIITAFAVKRSEVALQVGTKLMPIKNPSDFLGLWNHGFLADPPLDNQLRYEYFADGTFLDSYIEPGQPRNQWRIEARAYIETVWCSPAKYIPDGAWDESMWCCAKSQDGRIILWNCDASVIRILTR